MKFHMHTSRAPASIIVAGLAFIAIGATPHATSATPGEWFSDTSASAALVDVIGVLEETRMEVESLDQGDAVSPVPSSARLMSRYGMRRGRTTGRPTFHAGLDFYAPRGTEVVAARSGVVEIVASERSYNGTFSGYGNAVVIYHEDEDLWTFYAHLDESLVSPGMKVEAGEIIGRVGNTTNRRFVGMGVHLHFEVRERTHDGGAPFPGRYRINNINPETWLVEHGIQYDRTGLVIEDAPAIELARTTTEDAPQG